jgi:hypothetical protein
MRFEQAFRDAQNSGDKTFEFEGKSYSTKMKPTPTPPKRDVPREDDFPSTPDAPSQEKSYPAEVEKPQPMRRPSGNAGEAPRARRSPFERMPNPYEADSSNEVQGPEKPSTTGRLRTVGQNYVEKNAGMPTDAATVSKPVEGYEESYRKGGAVKKKSGGTMKKNYGGAVKMKSGGSVRGAGIAQRGQGKMRMC